MIPVSEAARQFNVPRTTISNAVHKGRIPSKLVKSPKGGHKGRCRLVNPEDVKRYLSDPKPKPKERKYSKPSPFESSLTVYKDHYERGEIPPHLLPDFHVFIHAVLNDVETLGWAPTIRNVADRITLVESWAEYDAQALGYAHH